MPNAKLLTNNPEPFKGSPFQVLGSGLTEFKSFEQIIQNT